VQFSEPCLTSKFSFDSLEEDCAGLSKGSVAAPKFEMSSAQVPETVSRSE
jgi:hypothetical protein